MRRDPRSLLWDVREAALAIQTFTQGMDLIAYEHNALVQAAVERKFKVIGEALNQLSKLDPGLAARVPDLPHMVSFRNQLIHGYATVNPTTVWTISQTSVLSLINVVQDLMGNSV